MDELARTVSWSGNGVREIDWSYIESELGTLLPLEYKNLVARFPRGRFNGSLEIIQPSSPDRADIEEYLDAVFDEADRLQRAVREMSVHPDEVFPKIPGLFPWATIEGDYIVCSYLGERSRDSFASYVARIPYGAWIELNGSIVRCILDMIAGHIYRVSGLLSTDEPPNFVASSSAVRQRTTLAASESWAARAELSLLPHKEPNDAVDDLMELGLDTRSSEMVDWATVEGRLGHAMPQDYKRFIEEIGPGRYGNILVANPNGPNEDVPGLFDLSAWAGESLRKRYVNPPPVAPEPGGVLVWGKAPHGWYCGWAIDDFSKDMGAVIHFAGLHQHGIARSMTNYLHWYLVEGETSNSAPWSLPRPGDVRRRWKGQ